MSQSVKGEYIDVTIRVRKEKLGELIADHLPTNIQFKKIEAVREESYVNTKEVVKLLPAPNYTAKKLSPAQIKMLDIIHKSGGDLQEIQRMYNVVPHAVSRLLNTLKKYKVISQTSEGNYYVKEPT